MKQYQIKNSIGSGNFSTVYKVENPENKKIFALKVMKSHPKIAYRQAQILKMLKHPNVIQMYEFQQNEQESKLLLQYIGINTLDLYEAHSYGLREQQVKCILFQAALGLSYIHSFGIIHRDVKPQNLLIDKKNALVKIIDFGLAINENLVSTDYIATRWYRGPQNLLGTKQYTCLVDVFSLGCVIVELYLGNPLFPGSNNLDQIYKIFNILGYPNETSWPQGHHKMLQLGIKPQQNRTMQIDLKAILNPCDPLLIEVLQKMLILNPANRITCSEIVKHKYFKNIHLIVPPSVYKRYEQDFLQSKKNTENTKIAFKGMPQLKQYKFNSKYNMGSLLNRNNKNFSLKNKGTESIKSLDLCSRKDSSVDSIHSHKNNNLREKRDSSLTNPSLIPEFLPVNQARNRNNTQNNQTKKISLETHNKVKLSNQMEILRNQSEDKNKKSQIYSQNICRQKQLSSKRSTGDTLVKNMVAMKVSQSITQQSINQTSQIRHYAVSPPSHLQQQAIRNDRMLGIHRKQQKNVNFISPTNRVNLANNYNNFNGYNLALPRNISGSQISRLNFSSNQPTKIYNPKNQIHKPVNNYNLKFNIVPLKPQLNNFPQANNGVNKFQSQRYGSPPLQRKVFLSPNQMNPYLYEQRFGSPQAPRHIQRIKSPQQFFSPQNFNIKPRSPEIFRFQGNQGSFRPYI